MDRTDPTARVIDLARHRRPGYETDAPVAGLTPGELFPLSALRLWAAPHRQPQTTHPDWREGFVLADIEEWAAAAFDAFMGTVLAAATEPLDVRCARCPRLGADEAILLLAAGHLQRRHPLQATMLLGRWMPPAAVRIGIGHLGAFARAVADADLWIPSCRLEARRAGAAGVDPGLVRIHGRRNRLPCPIIPRYRFVMPAAPGASGGGTGMAYFIGFDPIAQPGRGAEAVAAGFETISATDSEARLAVSDGTTLVLYGSAFRYSEDGELLGGKVDRFEFLDGERPIFVATEIDLSAAAVLGFLADGRFDQLNAYLYAGHDLVEGSPGGDRIDAANGDDVVYGNDGPDQIRGGDGEDTLDGGDGDDLMVGGNGNDLIEAGAGDDMIFGNVGRDTITAGAGDDTVFGGKEYDVIYGGDGHDRIYTDLGGDDVWGDAGNDTIYVEGDGEDWVFFESGSGQDRVDGFDATTGDLIFILRHINNTDIVDFETLVDRIADDQFGNTIVDLGGANYFRLTDIDWTQADASWFAFYDASDFPPPSPLLGAAAA